MAKAGMHVVGNPLHLLPDKRVLEARLGKDRAERSFAFQSMLKVNIATTALSAFQPRVNPERVCHLCSSTIYCLTYALPLFIAQHWAKLLLHASFG